MALHDGVDWAKAAGAKGPNPCKTPGCGLVYTPGYFAEHVRDYHHGKAIQKRRPREERQA